MTENSKGVDPAHIPDWVRDEAGNLVPASSPLADKLAGIEGARISRDEAQRRSKPPYDYERLTYAMLEWIERTGGWER